MKLKIKTLELQDMINRSVKGASNNKMLPITSMMGVKLDNGTLTLTTTDATNYLYIRKSGVDGEDFNITVPEDLFAKLISKLNCEEVELSMQNDVLMVKGKGSYKIPLPLDENGQRVIFPTPAIANSADVSNTFWKKQEIDSILLSNKAALATSLDVPCYASYYVGKTVVSTDSYKLCGNDIHALDKPALISAQLMDLLDVMSSEDIKVTTSGNKIQFDTEDCTVYGVTSEGIDDFAIDAINGLLSQQFDSMCKVSKDGLLSVLDRLSLFIAPYDKNALNMTFTQEGIELSSKQTTGVELLEYTEVKDFKPFTCSIDISMLQAQVKAQSGEAVEMYYGGDNAIKMIDGKVTQVVALLES